MGKQNNQLKMLANLAKKRMMKGEYETPIKTPATPKVSSYFLKNAQALKKLTAKIVFVSIDNKIKPDFKDKVYEILQNDYYDLNPIKKLIDFNIYKNLSDIEKQSYILDIAEKYSYLKEQYYIENNQAI